MRSFEHIFIQSIGSALLLGLALSIFPAACSRAPRDESARIRRVENGLRPFSWALFGDEQRHPILEGMKTYGVPGVSLAVIEKGRLAWAKAYGVRDIRTGDPVTADTLFQAASISKMLNAVAVLQRAERGRWRLDRDVFGDIRKAGADHAGFIFISPHTAHNSCKQLHVFFFSPLFYHFIPFTIKICSTLSAFGHDIERHICTDICELSVD